MRTTTDEAAALRAAYKAHGFSSRMIGVRADYYSMGSSLHVTIKSPAVPYRWAHDLAEGKERIDRDQWGEILSGGNRFVHCSHDGATAKLLADRHLAAVKDAMAAIDQEESQNTLLPVVGCTDTYIGRTQFGRYSFWCGGSHAFEAGDATHAAYLLALRDPDQNRQPSVAS